MFNTAFLIRLRTIGRDVTKGGPIGLLAAHSLFLVPSPIADDYFCIVPFLTVIELLYMQ